jgi:hypothetical protein
MEIIALLAEGLTFLLHSRFQNSKKENIKSEVKCRKSGKFNLGKANNEIAKLGVNPGLLLEPSSNGFTDTLQCKRNEFGSRQCHSLLSLSLSLSLYVAYQMVCPALIKANFQRGENKWRLKEGRGSGIVSWRRRKRESESGAAWRGGIGSAR